MRNSKFVILVFLIFSFSGCASTVDKNGYYYVSSVLDGDTIILANTASLRYIGIDTPELREKIADEWIWNPQPYAIDALNLNKKLLEGKKVRLEFDEEHTDRYGRWLAYVFVNGRMVNEELLRHGYATVYIRRPNTNYIDRLKAAEKEAKENKRGLWSLK